MQHGKFCNHGIDNRVHYQKVADSAFSISFFLSCPTHSSHTLNHKYEGGFPQVVKEGTQFRISTGQRMWVRRRHCLWSRISNETSDRLNFPELTVTRDDTWMLKPQWNRPLSWPCLCFTSLKTSISNHRDGTETWPTCFREGTLQTQEGQCSYGVVTLCSCLFPPCSSPFWGNSTPSDMAPI